MFNWRILLAIAVALTTMSNGKKPDHHKMDKHISPNTVKNLKPRNISPKYDKDMIAIDLSSDCLADIDPEEILLDIVSLYPCLSVAQIYNNKAFRHHGDIYRVYLYVNAKKNDSNINCLETGININWNDYCILDITYDPLLDLHSYSCNSQSTNTIYYSTTKKPAAWHLDMINNIVDNKYGYPDISTDDDHNVDIWILDSGINANHKEFYNGQIIDEDKTFNFSIPHGTGTAACASGLNYGASKKFKIHDYPVCRAKGGGCSFSYIDLGLQKILNYLKTTKRRSVINLSLGSSGANVYTSSSNYFDNLFEDIINNGGIIIVSAGNDNVDACNYFFAYSENVIAVGAHDSTKSRSSFSNYGRCVDIYAPGSSIPTSYSTNDNNYISYVSGTSFSSPIIAGVVANYLYQNNTLTKDQIIQKLQSNDNKYTLSNCPAGNTCYGHYFSC